MSTKPTSAKRATVSERCIVEFHGLEDRDIAEIDRFLDDIVKGAVVDLSNGEIEERKKDCKRIDLTNKKICVEITIEDVE
jgi:hypothetical protein